MIYQIFSFSGCIIISEILPDIRAGPILLNFRPEYIELVSFLFSKSDFFLFCAIKLVDTKTIDNTYKVIYFENFI